MLKLLEVPEIKLPKMYVAQNETDVSLAKQHGLPFIVWTKSYSKLIKLLLIPLLDKLYPGINWYTLFKISKKKYASNIEMVGGGFNKIYGKVWQDSNTVDIAKEERIFHGVCADMVHNINLEAHIADQASHVDIINLINMNLFPQFIGDITDVIKTNIGHQLSWQDGYNKKHNMCCGNYHRACEPLNLIILDISNSIPRGISATMLTLLETLRSVVVADVIVTGSKSYYYPWGEQLPSAQWLRDNIGCANESSMFEGIIRNQIANKKYDHLISFGDNDAPHITGVIPYYGAIGEIHNYHTCFVQDTGYTKVLACLNPGIKKTYDNTWCKFIRRDLE